MADRHGTGMAPDTLRGLLSDAVQASAALLKAGFGQAVVKSQEGRDIKLAEDVASQDRILAVLQANSDWPVLTEEKGWLGTPPDGGGLYWLVDPLDGSFNYRQGVPLCCVSVALCRDMVPVAGAVYDFMRDEVFVGGRTLPLTLNGAPCPAAPPAQSIYATGFPAGADYSPEGVAAAMAVVGEWKKVRMIGTAALALAWVAAGRFDGYGENGTLWWDVAGGLALVEAVGGRFAVDGDGPMSRLDVTAVR